MRFPLLSGVVILLGSCSARPSLAQVPNGRPSDRKPIVVALFTQGKEVVIEPATERLRAHGITAEELECLRSRRLSEGNWKVEIQGKKFDLTDVATLSVRDLVTKPFTVELLDGREAVIMPDARKVGRYLLTGDYFERDVKGRLQLPLCNDPAEARVLADFPVPGGHVPNAWGPDHVHISIGEPLKTFAKVDIRGKPGPQAADLARMHAVRKHLDAGLNQGKGMA